MPGCTVWEAEFTLLVAGGAPVRVGTLLRYDARDPFAVCVSFDTGSPERIEWTFARQLLADGLRVAAGIGDVTVAPHGQRVVLSLRSPGGRAVLEAPRAVLAAFLERTHRLVPPGTEAAFVDLDRELAALLT